MTDNSSKVFGIVHFIDGHTEDIIDFCDATCLYDDVKTCIYFKTKTASYKFIERNEMIFTLHSENQTIRLLQRERNCLFYLCIDDKNDIYVNTCNIHYISISLEACKNIKYYASKAYKIVCKESCYHVNNIKDENKLVYNSLEEAIADGCRSCKHCFKDYYRSSKLILSASNYDYEAGFYSDYR